MATMSWKIYGRTEIRIEKGQVLHVPHRQRQSFGASECFIYKREGSTVRLEILREDITGTNDFAILRITAPSADICARELDGQLSDGFFEDSRVSEVVQVDPSEYPVRHAIEYSEVYADVAAMCPEYREYYWLRDTISACSF